MWMAETTLALGTVAAIGASIAAWAAIVAFCQQRPKLRSSLRVAEWLLMDSAAVWFLGVKLCVHNRSDRINSIQIVEVRIGSSQGTLIVPARIVSVGHTGETTVLDVPGSGRFSFPHHLVQFEQLLKLPLQVQPHDIQSGWVLFNLSPRTSNIDFELTIKAAKGKDRTFSFKVEDFES